MVDREQLRAQFRLAAITCAGLTIIPLLLLFVGWFMHVSPSSSGGVGSGSLPLLRLVPQVVLGCAPLVVVPVLRRLFKRQRLTAARGVPGGTLASMEQMLSSQATTEFAVWEIASLNGFVAFFLGASWGVFLGLVALTYLGYAVSFPRWSAWVEQADEIDSQSMSYPRAVSR